jgi:peptide/nickel transport system substrate-binding protein
MSAILSVVTVACGAASSTPTSAPPASTAPAEELTVVVPTFSAFNFDTYQGASLSGYANGILTGPVFETLWTYPLPGKEPQPFLLQSATPSPDFTNWTLKLRPGITFSNGDPMTADDIKFTFERNQNPATAISSTATLKGSTLTVVDPLTLRIDLKAPVLDLPANLAASPDLILPAKYLQQVGGPAFSQNPVGSGPYLVSTVQPGQTVTYAPNPAYWGGPSGSSRPLLQKIRLEAVPEEATRVSLLKSGQADIALISTDTRSDVESAGFKALVVPDANTYSVSFSGEYGDVPDSPIKNPLVREALTLALDKKSLADAVLGGTGDVPSLSPDSPAALKLPPTPYDPARARDLLQQAGYPNGFDLKFYKLDQCGTQDWALAVADYWQKIGVNTQVIPTAYATFRPKANTFPPPADLVGTASDICHPPDLTTAEGLNHLQSIYSSEGNGHLTNVADAEIDQALGARTPDAQIQAMAAAYQKLYANYPNILVFSFGNVYGVSKQAENYPLTPGWPTMLTWWVTNPAFPA